MDEQTTGELYLMRLALPPDVVAFEAAGLRAMLDRINNNLAALSEHIVKITNPTKELELIRAAGGLGVIDMIQRWLIEYVTNLDEVMVKAIAEADET
jgi:hypothetical protein